MLLLTCRHILGQLMKITLCTENWLQHVQRMDTNRIPKQALQYKPKVQWNIGRPRKRWRDELHLEVQVIGNMPKTSWTWWWWWCWWWWWNLCTYYRGADNSLARPHWKKQLKSRHFSSDMEVIAAAEIWLDGQPSELFLSGLQKLEFGRCSLFPSWSG